jgi:integrase
MAETVRPFKRSKHDNPQLISAIAEAVASRLSPEHARSAVAVTFDDIYQRWLNDYAKVHYQEWTWRNYERMYRSYFVGWKDQNVYHIRRGDVQAWVARLADNIGNTTANRNRELMRMIYNRAIEWELIPDNYNPATKIRHFATESRARFLQADELPRFFAALQTLRYEATRDCLLMCLLTAQRVGNVRAMAWDQIDFARMVWTIPRTKNGTGHVVPLVPLAMAILDRRVVNKKSQWVFANQKQTGPISRLQKAWERLIERAGIENLRIHDLRRSHASWQAIGGANISVIAKTLNHRDLHSTAIYARLNVTEQRNAMTMATNEILKAAGLPAPDDRDPAPCEKLGPAFEIGDDAWIDEHEAAVIAGVSVGKLQQMRFKNEGPAFLKSGFSVLYKPSLVKAWLHARAEAPASTI